MATALPESAGLVMSGEVVMARHRGGAHRAPDHLSPLVHWNGEPLPNWPLVTGRKAAARLGIPEGVLSGALQVRIIQRWPDGTQTTLEAYADSLDALDPVVSVLTLYRITCQGAEVEDEQPGA